MTTDDLLFFCFQFRNAVVIIVVENRGFVLSFNSDRLPFAFFSTLRRPRRLYSYDFTYKPTTYVKLS